MGCGSCGTTDAHGVPKGCNNNGSCGTGGCNKLEVFDWLANMDLPAGEKPFNILEVRFKNSRKEFFINENAIELFTGDVIAVEASPGHDIGVVSLTGELVKLQLKKKGINVNQTEFKKVYRKAKQADIDKWKQAQELETETMYRARTMAVELKLQMKISDVEYQGDKTKAVFYYTADERVDFRELIKVMADQFKVRIEMRQIGARQEASRLGGIGSCGRELCCSTWLTDFRSVSTSAARYQQLSLNPLKLAGQCGKLKCCLNYELDSYLDAIKDFPETEKRLETQKGNAFHQKTDIFKRVMWYSYVDEPSTFVELSVDRVKQIYQLNANAQKPEELVDKKNQQAVAKTYKPEPDYENVVGQDSLTRFDKKNPKKPNNKNRNKQGNKKPNASAGAANPTVAGETKQANPAPNKNNNRPENNNRRPNNNRNRPNNNNRKPNENKPNNPPKTE